MIVADDAPIAWTQWGEERESKENLSASVAKEKPICAHLWIKKRSPGNRRGSPLFSVVCSLL
jgi:hypothetical protein